MEYIVTINHKETLIIENLTNKNLSLKELNLDFSKNYLSTLDYKLLQTKFNQDIKDIQNAISCWWNNIIEKYNLKIKDPSKYRLYFDSDKIFII